MRQSSVDFRPAFIFRYTVQFHFPICRKRSTSQILFGLKRCFFRRILQRAPHLLARIHLLFQPVPGAENASLLLQQARISSLS